MPQPARASFETLAHVIALYSARRRESAAGTPWKAIVAAAIVEVVFLSRAEILGEASTNRRFVR